MSVCLCVVGLMLLAGTAGAATPTIATITLPPGVNTTSVTGTNFAAIAAPPGSSFTGNLSSLRVTRNREHDLSRITNDTKGIPTGGNKTGSFAEIDEKLSPAEAAALRSLIQNTLHAFAYDAATGAWNARNAENSITFMYTRDGTAEFSGGENAFGLTLLGIGRAGEISPAGKAGIRADGRQLNITRQEYTEWYRNDDAGVEQGLTITSRPAGNGLLQVRFRLDGDKLFSLRDNRTLTLTTASGAPLLDYTGLHAYSSDGRELPASLATDGTTLTWEVDDTGAAYPVTIDPVITSASSATARFTGGHDDDRFGWSVSLSPDGSRALVGAYNNNTAGAAYIFDKPPGGWSGTTSASSATARFTGGNAGDQFGWSVSLSSDGSRALVGAIYNDTAGTDAGAAYIFDNHGGVWSGTTSASSATARFTGGNESDHFGTSLFLSSDGSRALVGAYNNDTAGTDAGAVYIFDKPGGGWSGTTSASSATAIFTGGNAGDNFGFSTSLSSDGSRALVGAYGNDTAGTDAGAAYIFDKPGGWSGTTSASAATARFTGGNAGDRLGISASLSSDGSRALVGANSNQTAGPNAGAAYIFDKPPGGWSGTTSASSATARFTGAAGEYFGRSVSLSQDGLRALVGVSAGNHAGAAYLFDKPGGGWSGTTSNSSATAIFKGGANNDGFSYSESLSSDGSWAFVGAYLNGTAGSPAGAAYLFQLPSSFGSIQPASGSLYGGTPVTITGTNFVTGNLLDVTIGGAHATGIAVNSLTRITATTPASATTGATWVNITNGDGRTINTTGAYTYTNLPPTITGISPAAGPTSAGTLVNITGTELDRVTGVTFGSNAATITAHTATTINTTAPAGTGTVTVTVTTLSGSATTSYTYAEAPTIISISPTSGINTTSIDITNLAGTNFAAGATVKLNKTGFADIPGTVVTVDSSSQITCTFDLTNRIASEYNVVVANSDGQAAMLVNGFAVQAPGPVAAFSGTPTSGTVPLTVTFTDASTCTPTTWNWSFGDGTFSDIENPSHIYTTTGSYTVILNATNATPASNYLTKTNYITVSSVPASQSVGGSDDERPLLPSAPVSSGNLSVHVGGTTTVTDVTVTGTGINGLIVTSTEASGPGNEVTLPPGIVYEYLDITPARYTTITGAQIVFTVPQSWLDANHLSAQDVVLYQNTGKTWQALPTTFVKTVNGNVYFTATSPGFSRFAITGQVALTVQSLVATPAPTVQAAGDILKASATAQIPTTTNVTRKPVAVQTTAPPAAVSQPAPGFPLAAVALTGAGCVVLIGCAVLVRRWWIRRQNPALFRKYD